MNLSICCCLILVVTFNALEMVIMTPIAKRILPGLEVDGDPEDSSPGPLGEDKNKFAVPTVHAEVKPEPVRVSKTWRAGKKLPHYRNQRRLVDRGRKIKYLKRDSVRGNREADTNVYVVDETMTGYVPRPEDDLLQGQAMSLLDPGDELLYVRHRLQKLDFYFEFMKVMSEDCRQRMLCEVAREPARFYPLSSVLEDVTSFGGNGGYQYMTSQLINTTEGARLLSYIEASFRGQDRTRTCAVFQYRCPSPTEHMINYEALCLWREMVRWLTIHVVAQAR